MKADQLYQYMQYPEQLNEETLTELKELIERYPAFEGGWMLYLRNLKNINDVSFEQELINGAIRIQNRRKLYLLLNEKEKAQETALVESQPDNADELYNLFFPTEYKLESLEKTEETLSEIARSIQNKPGKKVRLIDKFLEAQPKMPPVKEDASTSPTDSLPAQEDMNEEFVTETLALIYTQQGYYKKALQIFKKLSLKYPEKSTYFAAQIEKVNHLMNN
jgi:tetratricopeptide (TPR) repeat protein